MVRKQIHLTEAQNKSLAELAVRKGRSQSDLIREAVDRLVAESDNRAWRERWLEALEQSFGAWKDEGDVEGRIAEGRDRLRERAKRLWQDS